MTTDVSIWGAFVAGVVSFLSPCVLPLVPGYVSMLSGLGIEDLKQGKGARGTLLASSLAFVTGFSLVFISFGASASAVGQFLLRNKTLLAPVAGAIIVLFGLHLIGWLAKWTPSVSWTIGGVLAAVALAVYVFPALTRNITAIHFFSIALIFLFGPSLTRLLNRDVRFHKLGGQPGLVGGFLMGFGFAFGWTPCIGPILAAVLGLAAAQETVGQGVFLLAVYSAGLAIPFLLAALGIGGFLRFYQNFRRHLHAVEVASGMILLAVGALVFANRLTWLAGKFGFLNDVVLWLERSLTSGA
ncbi:MAG: cytochrome c biogenesis CcdA family protein [Candidatus Acidiferrales bacterium]